MASIIPMLFSIIANPFIAMNMSPTDYATVGYYSAFNTLLTPVINFYLLHYYTKKYFELTTEERIELKAVLVKALMFFSLIISVIALFGLYIYTTVFNKGSEIPFSPYALISVMSIPITGIYSLNLVDYRMQRRSKDFFILSVTNGVLALCLSVLLVVVLKYGALGKFLSVFVANLIIFIYCFYTNREIFKVKFNKQIFNDALKFCYPLVIAAMLSFFSNGYDKIVLERIGNVHELGYYVVGVQIAGYLSVFSTSIDDTFQPDIFQSVVQRDFKKCTKIILSKIGLLSVIVLFFIAFAPFLVDVLTAGRYVVSTKYAMIVSLSAISSMLYHSLSQVTIALGYTKITLINKVVGSILCVAMYTMLILKWGAIGAAWGTVVSFIIFFIGNLFLVWIKNRSSLLYAKEK